VNAPPRVRVVPVAVIPIKAHKLEGRQQPSPVAPVHVNPPDTKVQQHKDKAVAIVVDIAPMQVTAVRNETPRHIPPAITPRLAQKVVHTNPSIPIVPKQV
jgi:hypothetical protein